MGDAGPDEDEQMHRFSGQVAGLPTSSCFASIVHGELCRLALRATVAQELRPADDLRT
jgi:hypothetical protein